MEVDEFNALINSEEIVFVDFYAPWCAPCRKMTPMIDSHKTEYKDRITIVKINVDVSKKLMRELGIVSVPYLVLYHKENILFSRNGLISREKIKELFNKNIL